MPPVAKKAKKEAEAKAKKEAEAKAKKETEAKAKKDAEAKPKKETEAKAKKEATAKAKVKNENEKESANASDRSSETGEDSEDYRRALQDSDISFLKDEVAALKKDRHRRTSRTRKRSSRSRSRSSSSSSSTERSNRSAKYVADDPEVEAWRPKKWPKRKSDLRIQMQNTVTRISSKNPPGYVTSEIDFISSLVGSVDDPERLKHIIGKRLVIIMTKVDVGGDFAAVEASMKAAMAGKDSTHWAKAKAKVTASKKGKSRNHHDASAKKSHSFRNKKRFLHGKNSDKKDTKNA